MPTSDITALSQDTGEMIAEVERTGRPLVVTRDGRPVVVLCAIGADDLEDIILAYAPAFVRSRAEADDELRRGETRSLDAVLRELGEEAR